MSEWLRGYLTGLMVAFSVAALVVVGVALVLAVSGE